MPCCGYYARSLLKSVELSKKSVENLELLMLYVQTSHRFNDVLLYTQYVRLNI